MNFIPAIEYTSAPITITFLLPPVDDFRNEDLTANTRVTTSTAGVDQAQFNYIREKRTIKLSFIDEAIKQQFDTFFKDHAAKGLEFKYFESNDEIDFITVTLDRTSYKPKILFPSNTPNEYVYDFTFVMRRTL